MNFGTKFLLVWKYVTNSSLFFCFFVSSILTFFIMTLFYLSTVILTAYSFFLLIILLIVPMLHHHADPHSLSLYLSMYILVFYDSSQQVYKPQIRFDVTQIRFLVNLTIILNSHLRSKSSPKLSSRSKLSLTWTSYNKKRISFSRDCNHSSKNSTCIWFVLSSFLSF